MRKDLKDMLLALFARCWKGKCESLANWFTKDGVEFRKLFIAKLHRSRTIKNRH